MTNCAIVGINWGDEGKGRMVDLLTEDYDVVVRFQGGGKLRMIQNGGLAAGGKKIFFKLLRLGKLDKLFTHQIIKGNFPFPPPAQLQDFIYGCVTNDYLAKGIECVLDMHLVGFIFGHGNSPSLNNSAGRQYSLLSPLDCLPAKTGGTIRNRRDSGGDAANLFGTFCPKEPGLGRLPNKHFCGPPAQQKFRSVATPELLAVCALP